MINLIDWIIHYVFSEKGDPDFLADIHTHGLNSHGHPEIMMTIALPQDLSAAILNDLGQRILNGERFDNEEIKYDIIRGNLPVKIIKTNINNEDMSVLIFPDQNGKLPDDENCQYPYNMQMHYLEFIEERYKK